MWRWRKHRNQDEPIGLGLDEVLAALSRDLVHASDGTLARGGGYGLGVERAEVELSVTVVKETSGTAEGTATVRVLPWGMSTSVTGHTELSRQNSYIHRVTLALIPVIAENIPKNPSEPKTAAPPQEAGASESIWNTYQSRHSINGNAAEINPYVLPPVQEPDAPEYELPARERRRREIYSPGTGRPVAEGLPVFKPDVQAETDSQ
jgi:hypothetical protein